MRFAITLSQLTFYIVLEIQLPADLLFSAQARYRVQMVNILLNMIYFIFWNKANLIVAFCFTFFT